MSDSQMLFFGHHLIPLLSLPGAAGVLGGKVQLPAVKAACKSAERIHGALTLAVRFELAVVPATPDFFDPDNIPTKVRNLAWETIRKTQRLQWVIPTRNPENISRSLPPTWIGKGFQNLCIGYIADSDVDFAAKLQALRNAPLLHRMILITSSIPPIDLPEHLNGIDWVVFTGNPDDAALAETIGSSCRQARAAFLFHQSDAQWENVSTMDAYEDGSPWPTHPFGAKIDLSRPTLPKLMTHQTAASGMPIPSAPEAESSAPPAALAMKSNEQSNEPDAHPQPPAEVLDFEIVNAETDKSAPESVSSINFVAGDDVQDFTRLDCVVRRGLATFIEVGQALDEIRKRELWRAGGHASWAEYCQAVGGLTKVHANRLIRAAGIAGHLAGVEPIGFAPVAESQIRPLYRLQTPEQYAQAWKLGVERSKGQPTAAVISDIVAELMAEESPQKKSKPDLKQLRIEAFSHLRDAFHAKRPKKEIELRLTELETLLKIP